MATLRMDLRPLVPAPHQLSDMELLARFVDDRDETAFTALVRRHCRMVHGVCRRVLGHSPDVDDAFQATFLVLVKKSHQLVVRTDLSAWLFAVALRAARELLRRRCRRANREVVGEVPELASEFHETMDSESSRIVLDEVANLSESYRSAVVLCELDGISRADAAKRLGIPEGTLSSRLAAARKQLATRLTARGLSLACLAPLGGFVPSAMANTVTMQVFTSAASSSVVTELTEVLMRIHKVQWLGKLMVVLAMLTCAIVGVGFSNDRPTSPAKAAVAIKGEWAITFREEVRYLSSSGREVQRIHYEQAKAIDPELLTGQLTIGIGSLVKVVRYVCTSGRVGPGGVVPLAAKGMRVMTPGPQPTIRRIPNVDDNIHHVVVGWSADGKRYLASGSSGGDIWYGSHGYKATWVDVTTGERERLPFAERFHVIDVTHDGTRFLAYRHTRRQLFQPGFQSGNDDLCVLNETGNVLATFPVNKKSTDEISALSQRRLAPDGATVAVLTSPTKDNSEKASRLTLIRRVGNEIQGEVVASPTLGLECRAAAWSPDGRQVVSVWTVPKSTKNQRQWHIGVCDANGQNMRSVTTIDTIADETIRDLSWY